MDEKQSRKHRKARPGPEEANVDDEWLSWVIENIGRPRPCDLCHRTVPPDELREIWLPLAVITEWGELTPHKAQWVCPRCPG